MKDPAGAWPSLWPIPALIARLQCGSLLHDLTRPKQKTVGHDVREYALENAAADVMRDHFGSDRVITQTRVADSLRVQTSVFPATAKPDVAIREGHRLHLCELKSSRTDYGRFDCVLDGRARDYFRTLGHTGPNPWEVEQDLAKLHLYKTLSNSVGSCLFLMVDAFTGPGCWTKVFQDLDVFRETMRSQFVRDLGASLLPRTQIQPLIVGEIQVQIITCEVHCDEELNRTSSPLSTSQQSRVEDELRAGDRPGLG